MSKHSREEHELKQIISSSNYSGEHL